MTFFYVYPEQARNFAEEDATQEDLGVAINYILRDVWKTNSSAAWQPYITSELTKCYGIRKVKSI